MAVDRPTPLTVLVALPGPEPLHSVVAALDHLRFPYRLASPDEGLQPAEEPGVIYCLTVPVGGRLARLPRPVVLLTTLEHEAAMNILIRGVALLPSDELTPPSFLRSLILATLGTHDDFVAHHLTQLEMFSRVPLQLFHAFLRQPSDTRRLRDLRRAMKLSRARAQALVRVTGRFERAEHLFAALRCASWAVLVGRGLARPAVEAYLGMGDRAAFRRACQRAGVPAPRDGLSLMAFSS